MTTAAAPHLFQPITLNGLTARNRVVVAPMVTYASERGHVGDWHLMHLGRFAAGGAGLIMMESAKIDPAGSGTLNDVALWSDAFIPGLMRVVEFIHGYGALVGIQLSHAGRKARNAMPWEGRGPLSLAEAGKVDWDWTLVGPSAVPHSVVHDAPRPLSIPEIEGLVQAWGDAAQRADSADFDAVEIHAAHGYLIHQFLSEAANRRTDRYGGSLINRMRFAVEVAAHVRSRWPAHKPLFVRISSIDEQGWSIEDSIALAKSLRAVGVDVIDCSSGGIGSGLSTLGGNAELGYGYQAGYASSIRAGADIKTMAVGLIIHAEQAEEILREGRADLVAIGREMLLNPNWPLDAAQKLGFPDILAQLRPNYGFWLEKRDLASFGGRPSTWAGPAGRYSGTC